MTFDPSATNDDTVAHLAATDLFALLEPDELAAVAPAFAPELCRPGHVLGTAGEIDDHLSVVIEGMVSFDRRAEDGTLEHLAFGDYGYAFGLRGVFAGEPRTSSAVAMVEPTILLRAERAALWRALAGRPGLADRLLLPDDIRDRLRLQDVDTVVEGEYQVGIFRRHWVALAANLVLPTLVLLATVALGLSATAFGAFLEAASPLVVIVTGLLSIALPTAAFTWAVLDYHRDCLIVTSQRVMHLEEKPLIDARHTQAPLARIQDVRVITPGLAARLLGYGTIVVQTASSHGAIRFTHLPDPEEVRELIFGQVERARQVDRIERDSWIAAQVRAALGMGPEPERRGTSPVPGAARREPPSLARRAATAPLRYVMPHLRMQEGEVVTWRKHWWFLLRRTALPLTGLAALAVAQLWLSGSGEGLPRLLAWPIALVLLVWAGWEHANWRNDLYQLTDDHLVDIERLPFGIRGERRQASLAHVQDLRYVVPNPLATLLRYGHVMIETAAELGNFSFDGVYQPASVQQEIVERIEAYRGRQSKADEELRAAEWARWLAAYHRLTTGSADQGGPEPSRPAPPPPAP